MRARWTSTSRVWMCSSLMAAILAVALAQGCRVGPDYEAPETTVPDLWHESAIRGVTLGEAALQRWWEVLDDPLLEDLIRRAETANLDLVRAIARIREARALYGVAKGERYPDVNASGSASYGELSDNGQFPAPDGGFDASGLYSAGFDAVWELDFFGRISRSIEAASATYQASVEDYRDVLVSLFAEVARNYIDVRSFQARLAYARHNVEVQEDSVQLTRDRFDAGLVSALDVAQAQSNLASSKARIPLLETGLTVALNRLAVLLGEVPGELDDELRDELKIPDPPSNVTVGLPGDLLRQRPDVRRAERDLAAQTARVGIAVADLYPRFSLTGFLGLESGDIGDLFDGGSVTWNFGLPFSWNIFDGGRRRGRIDAEWARTEQLLSFYEQTVLLALEEVEFALVSYDREQARGTLLREAVTATERSLALVQTQYRSGLTDFQNVLDTQRSLFSQQDQLAESEGFVIQNLIAIYKSVGGGWTEDPDQPDTGTLGALSRPPAQE